MIHELNQLNGKQILSELSHDLMTQNSTLQNKEVMLALSKIQVGDLISGKLILEDNQTLLKLQDGIKLMAQLKNPMLSDSLSDFLVVGKDRQHLELEQVEVNKASAKEVKLEEAIIKELELPDTSEMKTVVSQWMDKQLPLVKNQMLQLYHLAKDYEMPTETLVNLKNHNELVSEGELKLLGQFKEEGISLVEHAIEQSFEGTSKEQMIGFLQAMGEKFSAEGLKEIMGPFLELGSAKMNPDEKQDMLPKIPDASKQDTPLDEKELSFTAMKDEPSVSQNVKEEYAHLLKALPNRQLKALAHHIARKYLVMDQKAIANGNEEELHKIGEAAKRLKEVLSEVEKHTEKEVAKESKQVLQQISQTMDKYNTQGEYYCFPLQVGEHETSGELYFFKPKKSKKGAGSQKGMYIVLALDMPSLKHIEVHLIEDKKQLNLKLKVANDEILKQMESHQKQLDELMKDGMMPIGKIQFECLKETISQKVKAYEKEIGRLDFRI